MLFETDGFDLPGGDIGKHFKIPSKREAQQLAFNTIQRDNECVNWIENKKCSYERNIKKSNSKVEKFKPGKCFLFMLGK